MKLFPTQKRHYFTKGASPRIYTRASTNSYAWIMHSGSSVKTSVKWRFALTTPLLLNAGGCEGLQNQEGVVFESEQELVHAIMERSDSNELKKWVAERLAALASYRAEKELSTCPESNIDLSYSLRSYYQTLYLDFGNLFVKYESLIDCRSNFRTSQ